MIFGRKKKEAIIDGNSLVELHKAIVDEIELKAKELFKDDDVRAFAVDIVLEKLSLHSKAAIKNMYEVVSVNQL